MKEFDPKKRARKALENLADRYNPKTFWVSDQVSDIIDVTEKHSIVFENREAKRREEARLRALDNRQKKVYGDQWGGW